VEPSGGNLPDMAAIITGSDSGIGKAIAVALARRRHDVGITYSRDEEGADATAREVGSHGRRAEQERPGVPAGRPGDAREVAELIAYLASPEASYTNGASFVIDGGMLLMAAKANQIAVG
jgi:NAD(P)-dependent dehydrogenase (short-subunit alcohol dehydrogenase family)